MLPRILESSSSPRGNRPQNPSQNRLGRGRAETANPRDCYRFWWGGFWVEALEILAVTVIFLLAHLVFASMSATRVRVHPFCEARQQGSSSSGVGPSPSSAAAPAATRNIPEPCRVRLCLDGLITNVGQARFGHGQCSVGALMGLHKSISKDIEGIKQLSLNTHHERNWEQKINLKEMNQLKSRWMPQS